MTETIKKIDGVYHVAITSAGRRKYISTGCANKTEAEKVVAESGVEKLNTAAKAGRLTQKAIGQILTGRNLTCAKALTEYQRLKSVSKSAKTIANNTLVVGTWLKEMKLETIPPSAVTASHISSWINDPDSERKRSTRQVALASLRTFFDFCASQGWIAADPSQLVAIDYSVLSHEQKECGDKQPFTEAEVKLLISELRKDWNKAQSGKQELFRDASAVLFWLFAVTAAKETGLRLSDLASLEWRSFAEPGQLIVWTEKTNKRVEHTISEGLQGLLAEIPVEDTDYLFPQQRAMIRDVSKRAGLSVQFSRLLERLKIEGKSFHSLRHYKASHAFSKMDKDGLARKLAEVLSVSQIADLLGHSNQKTTKGYIH